MSFTSWLFPQQSLTRRAGHGHNTKPNRRPSRKLALEHLEDRRLLSVTLGANFEGINFNNTGVTAEYAAASGPNNVVEVANDEIRIYGKSGNIISTQEWGDLSNPLQESLWGTAASFWSPITDVPNDPYDDPNVMFDNSVINASGPAGRWIVSGLDDDTVPAVFDFAVSNDSNPSDGFTVMHAITLEAGFQALSCSAGSNANAYVFTFNMCSETTGGFNHVQVLSIQKSTVIGQSNATLTTFSADRSDGLSSLTPTIMHGAATGGPMWFVTEGPSNADGNVDQIDVVEMTNILSNTPTFQDNFIYVAPYNQDIPNALQPGATTIDDYGSNILNAAMRNNILVADQTVTVGTDGNALVRWYQFSTAGGSPTLSQYGQINPDNGTDIDTYMPSIDIDANDDLGMTFMQSSANQYMSMYVTGRAPTDPSGTMAPEVLAAAGQVIYTYGEVGDYSAISVDPATGTSFWAANMYDPSTAVIVGTDVANFSVAPTITLAIAGFPSSTTAGVPATFTVTAENAGGGVDTGYTGTVQFSSSDPLAVLPGNYTFTDANQGVYTFSATLETAGSQSLTATDITTGATTGSETGITVNPAAASTLTVTGFPSPTNVGIAGSFTVTALDPYGNKATGYTGTVNFTSSDPLASLPAAYTFTAADGGADTFSATLNTTGTQSLTATDTTTGSITGTQAAITVNPAAAPASTLSVSGFPSSATAGVAGTITVTALAANGSIATGYLGTIHFASSDAQAGLPANYTFTAANQGAHTFTVTLKTAGSQSITAADTATGSITGSETGITVTPARAAALVFSNVPASATAGSAFTLTLIADDAYGNTATGYLGTVHFTSSDSKAVLPANYTFTSSDAGKHVFSATLKTAGSQSLTATDTVTSSITGKASGIVVHPAAASQFILSAPSSVTHGVAFSLTLTVEDAYGNVVTGYVGTVQFTSSDSTATLPASFTFTAGDAGVYTFIDKTTLEKKGKQTITVTDTVNSALTATDSITVD